MSQSPAKHPSAALRISPGLIDDALSALTALLDFSYPADAVLSRFFREHKSLGPRERGFIAESVYTVLRRKRSLERLCQLSGEKATPRRLFLAALALPMGIGRRSLEEAFKGKELDWLGKLKELAAQSGEGDGDGGQGVALTLAERADFPDWLVDMLRDSGLPGSVPGQDFDAGLLRLARSLNQPAPLDLRVNSLKAGRDEVLIRLRNEGLEAEPMPYSPSGIRLKGKPSLARHPLFLGGAIEIQDEGSQLLGHLLAPKRGEMVADFCAGAGGKTLLLGDLMRSTGRLYAFDVSDKRLAKLKPRAARAGLSNIHPAVIASEHDQRIKRLAGKLDRVLVDAPCSGLGTLRRNPDLKWRQSPASVAELTAKQGEILAAAARLVKEGGRLVYATCSLLAAENEAVVDAFLATHPGFQRVSCAEALAKQMISLDTGMDLHLLPQLHGTDGFYAAVLERRA